MADLIKPYGQNVVDVLPSVEERRESEGTQVSSHSVELVSGVCNPVGNAMNTDKGVHQTPLPARPIPS